MSRLDSIALEGIEKAEKGGDGGRGTVSSSGESDSDGIAHDLNQMR